MEIAIKIIKREIAQREFANREVPKNLMFDEISKEIKSLKKMLALTKENEELREAYLYWKSQARKDQAMVKELDNAIRRFKNHCDGHGYPTKSFKEKVRKLLTHKN